MDRKKIFNELVQYYAKLFPNAANKQKKVSESWGELRTITDATTLLNAVDAKKKEWKQIQLRQGRKNIGKFFTLPQTKRKSSETTETSTLPKATSSTEAEVDLTQNEEDNVPQTEEGGPPAPQVAKEGSPEVVCLLNCFIFE